MLWSFRTALNLSDYENKGRRNIYAPAWSGHDTGLSYGECVLAVWRHLVKDYSVCVHIAVNGFLTKSNVLVKLLLRSYHEVPKQTLKLITRLNPL